MTYDPAIARAARELKEAASLVGLALVSLKYDPETATQEEQALVGISAQLHLFAKDYRRRSGES